MASLPSYDKHSPVILYVQRYLSLEKYIVKQFVHQRHETLQNSQQYVLLLSQLVKPALTSHASDILLVQGWHAITQ